MEQTYTKLPYRHMSVVTTEAINYIKSRKEHNIISLKTRWNKLNKMCMGGIESNIVMTVTGISGSGKSSFVNELQTDLIDNNPGKQIVILNFSLEMVGFRQVGRTLSNKLRRMTSDLYSSNKDLDDETFGKVVDVSNQLKNYPIYFVDEPGSPQQVLQTVNEFYNEHVKGQNKYVIHDIKNDEFLETINKKLWGYDKKAYAEKALVRIAKSAGRNKEEFEVLNCELLVFKDK